MKNIHPNHLLIEEYLDGQLSAGERARLEQQTAQDPELAARVEHLKQHRALRKATLATWMPAEEESRVIAGAFMAQLREAEVAPLAKIGPARNVWLRGSVAAAAGVVLLAGGFWAGRSTAPTTVATVTPPAQKVAQASPVRVVIYNTDGGVAANKQFDTTDAADKYVEMYTAQQQTVATIDQNAENGIPLSGNF